MSGVAGLLELLPPGSADSATTSTGVPNSRVVFASKAFPCTAVQRVMVQEGLGLDVAGGGEIRTALKAGVDPALVVLHGNAKSVDELTLAVRHGVGPVDHHEPDDVLSLIHI